MSHDWVNVSSTRPASMLVLLSVTISASISTLSLMSKPRQNFSNQLLTPSICIVLLTQTDVVIYYQKGLVEAQSDLYTYIHMTLSVFFAQARSK